MTPTPSHARGVSRQPGGDIVAWATVLAHRPPDARHDVAARLEGCGIGPARVAATLADGGDALHAARSSGDPDWAAPFGGPLAVALLAAEVGALTAHLTSRASAVRGAAVDDLLEDVSAVSVAAALGVSRQKVYDIARARRAGPFLDRTPWSTGGADND